MPFSGLRLSVSSRLTRGDTLPHVHRFFLRKESATENPRDGARERNKQLWGNRQEKKKTPTTQWAKQHYWLFKTVFTENNQFERIMEASPRRNTPGYKNILSSRIYTDPAGRPSNCRRCIDYLPINEKFIVCHPSLTMTQPNFRKFKEHEYTRFT